MKTRLVVSLLGLLFGLFLSGAAVLPVYAAVTTGKEIRVLVVYHPDYLAKSAHIMAAYESVLQEEGVSYATSDVNRLVALNPATVAQTSPALIFPDAVLQNVPDAFVAWTQTYLANGGNVAVIYDAGIKDSRGIYLNQAAFAEITGVNYITYGTNAATAFTSGTVQFVSQSALDFFQITPGKSSAKLIISGYGYGELSYPMARAKPIRELPAGSIYAEGILKDGDKAPVIVLGEYAKGKVLFVNLPLGHLKASEDELPLRANLRTFLFDVVQIPHVLGVAGGLGGIIINWHVDSVVEYDTLPMMKKLGYLRKGLNASIHITAGDDFIKIGDSEGFDACGMAKSLTRMLGQYGTLGSHGGWAHNWFADNIRSGLFKEKEIKYYIDKNSKCIESVVGGKITEYSAPVGVHPQPLATKVLEELGIIAYYYTGDMGSGPNRAFTAGEKISDKVIGFPVTPFGVSASFYEMHEKVKNTDAEVTKHLTDLLEYTSRNKVFRLVYSHPRDIGYYLEPIKVFFDQAEALQEQHLLKVRSMTDVARFLLRMLKTTFVFRENETELTVTLNNPESLQEITVAIPKDKYGKPTAEHTTLQEDARYYYLTIGGSDETEKTIFAPRR